MHYQWTVPVLRFNPAIRENTGNMITIPTKAAELLKKSGYSKGFRLNLMLQDYSPQEEIFMHRTSRNSEALKLLNIEIELNKYSQTEYNKKLYTKDYMLASRFSFTAVRDPSYWGLWFKSGTFLNYTGISDAVLDGLLMEQGKHSQC